MFNILVAQDWGVSFVPGVLCGTCTLANTLAKAISASAFHPKLKPWAFRCTALQCL